MSLSHIFLLAVSHNRTGLGWSDVDEGIVQTGIGVFTGTVELKDGPLRVLPLQRFFKTLAEGDLFP